ncbi:hypothetical protein NOK12_39410 [Nocardioides sp. OK12]|nr:hypothetical protein NOK12_39410 [Nocardioides sp. OK12]
MRLVSLTPHIPRAKGTPQDGESEILAQAKVLPAKIKSAVTRQRNVNNAVKQGLPELGDIIDSLEFMYKSRKRSIREPGPSPEFLRANGQILLQMLAQLRE